MKWKTTCWLLLLAVVLFAFIYLVDRQTPAESISPTPLLQIKPENITGIQLSRGTNLVLWAEKTNQTWNLTLPVHYPAQSLAIESLVQTLAGLATHSYITAKELAGNRRSTAEFGLDVPQATLTLLQGRHHTDLLFGAKTPVGDHVYAQLLTTPGIYVIEAEVFDRLPRTEHDWRDPSLLNLLGLTFDHMEVRAPGRGFAIQANPTNGMFYLSRPQMVRASLPKVTALLQKLQAARVVQFVDDARLDLESLGLQPPEAELAFASGTNDLLVVQFGKSPTNDPAVVYARRLSQMNIVLVPKPILDAVLTPHTDLRDRHLFSFTPAQMDIIEVAAAEKFTVRRQTNGVWMVTEPQAVMADPELMREWLDGIERLEGAVEKDVVTDFTLYKLTPPARQYSLKTSVTNTDGTVTNRLLSQLDIGGLQQDKIFAHRSDENSVYSITRADFDQMPAASWQLRDRRIWSFTTNQVSRVTVRHRGYVRQWDRSAAGQWNFAPGSQGILDNKQFALEETMFRLGELRASVWVAKGGAQRDLYGFTDDGYKMTIDLKNADKSNVLTLELGGAAPSSNYHYALATIDGQSWIFEFPIALFFQLLRDFSNPTLQTAAPTNP